MRKRLKNHREVCHYWANQTQPEGKCGNIFFEGPTIYSYGHHFPMATFTDKNIVLMTTGKYSVSTSGHVSMVRRALPHDIRVLDVPDVARPNHKANLSSFQARIDQEVETLTRCRQGADWRLATIARLVEDARVYRDTFMNGKGTLPTLPEDFGKITEKAREREAKKAEADKVRDDRRRAAYEERQRLEALELPKKIDAWRSGVSVRLPYSIPVMLRLSKDGKNVETSMGANVPLDHAERLFKIIKRCRDCGETFEANGRTIPIGVYHVSKIDAAGTLTAGCHTITWEETERFAKERGWTK